jgi:hypothetical protein
MRASLTVSRVRRGVLLAVSVYLFIFALMLMKDGAAGLEPLVKEWLHIDGVANAVGFGWLFAYFVLSGSPVAATALTLLDGGVLDAIEAFGMIAGSRLGASFVVLVVGLVYALRGHERRSSLSVGILALVVTATLQTSSIVFGVPILRSGIVPVRDMTGGGELFSVLDRLVGVPADRLAAFLSGIGGSPLIFVVGLGAILVSFSTFDRSLPPLRLEGTALGDVPRLLYRPLVMFGLGLAVTLVSMSVSVSLSLLVPLSARGYVRRENLIPYIMGADVTTFVDTLVASMVLVNPAGFTVVLVQMITATVTSLVILLVALRPYEQAMLRVTRWVTSSNRTLGAFVIVLFLVPIVLLMM